MPRYMLLLYDDPTGWSKMSPDQQQKAMEKYMAWRKKPFVVDSNRLGLDSGKILRTQGGQARATDGPYSETKEVLGGYYTIDAANYEEAVERSLDHPHVEHGTIELRHVYGT